MYVCMYVCMYVYLYIYISISIFTHLSLPQLSDLLLQFHFPQFLYLPVKESRRLGFNMWVKPNNDACRELHVRNQIPRRKKRKMSRRKKDSMMKNK